MIYGLYLSATGVLTNSYRQDVIANNIANSETVGFKRSLAQFKERPTAVREMGLSPEASNKLLENLGGGTLAVPTVVDQSQGEFEPTGNALDAAIAGPGYFRINANGKTQLTRDGRFTVNSAGHLALMTNSNNEVLDTGGNPIPIDPGATGATTISQDGTIVQNNTPVARLGVFEVPDARLVTPAGGTLLNYPDSNALRPSASAVRSEYIERSNVDSASELTELMDAERQLEANANMIKVQDTTLNRLVNDVGKIS